MSRDYRLALVCTGRGAASHPRRELAVLVPVAPRADLEIFRSMGAEIPEPNADYAADLARGWGVAGSSRSFSPVNGELIEKNIVGNRKFPVQLQDLPSGDVALRLPCPMCPRGRNVHLVFASVAFNAGDETLQGLVETVSSVRVDIGTLLL